MYGKILVPVDGSDASNAGLVEAIKVAKNRGGAIRLVHVENENILMTPYDAGFAYPQVSEALREYGQIVLKDAAAMVRGAGVAADTICEDARGEQVGSHIVRLAREWPADLIVMGTHGRRGVRRIVLGSDAEFVVRHTPVPVLLVRSLQDVAK
jgi:nucleotide-binding universal stress UspA family protein